MKSQAQLIAQIIKGENISKAPIYLVAHSIGALIGTWICQELDGTMDTFFSIEGNLTLADSYFSSKPLEYSSPSDFALAFESEIFLLAQQEERFRRYYSSLRLADPEAMLITLFAIPILCLSQLIKERFRFRSPFYLPLILHLGLFAYLYQIA